MAGDYKIEFRKVDVKKFRELTDQQLRIVLQTLFHKYPYGWTIIKKGNREEGMKLSIEEKMVQNFSAL